jgi:hypothetical protein
MMEVRQAEYMSCMKEEGMHTEFSHGNMKESDRSKDLGT